MTMRYIIHTDPYVREVSYERLKNLAFGGIVQSIPVIPYPFLGIGEHVIPKSRVNTREIG